MNLDNLTVGTISHGTLRAQDLASAFLALADRIEVEIPLILRADAERIATDPMPDAEDADTLAAIGDLIDDELPPYLYLGTLEGDGSDWGVWYVPWCDEEVGNALLAVDRAYRSDSGGEEIGLLRSAVDLLTAALRDALGG